MDFLKSAKHPQTLEFLEMNLDLDLKNQPLPDPLE